MELDRFDRSGKICTSNDIARYLILDKALSPTLDKDAEVAFQALAESEVAERNAQQVFLAHLAAVVSPTLHADIVEYLGSGEGVFSDFSFVAHPHGQILLERGYSELREIYVNQAENGGITGDSFAGAVYIPLPDGRFFKFFYEM